MSDIATIGEGVTWRVALEVFWAQVCYAFLVAAIIDAPFFVLSNKGVMPEKLYDLIIDLSPFVAQAYAIRRSLGIDYKSFSIRVNKKNG
jgi:hypothetical protein